MSERQTVLLVDDDSEFLESGRMLLEAAGYEVHTASTGAEGLRLAERLHPQLVILDVMMESPREGFRVNYLLHQDPAFEDIPVLMVTGVNAVVDGSYRFDVERGWPCEAFLDKPVLPEVLLSKVRALLASAPLCPA